MYKIDEIDHQLIALLRDNARRSVVDLSRRLGLTRATVQNRIKRLEREAVILKYSVETAGEDQQSNVRAIMTLSVEGKMAQKVAAQMRGFPDVCRIHFTNGRWDLIAEIQTRDLQSFNHLLTEIRLIDGVSSTETNLLLETIK